MQRSERLATESNQPVSLAELGTRGSERHYERSVQELEAGSSPLVHRGRDMIKDDVSVEGMPQSERLTAIGDGKTRLGRPGREQLVAEAEDALDHGSGGEQLTAAASGSIVIAGSSDFIDGAAQARAGGYSTAAAVALEAGGGKSGLLATAEAAASLDD